MLLIGDRKFKSYALRLMKVTDGSDVVLEAEDDEEKEQDGGDDGSKPLNAEQYVMLRVLPLARRLRKDAPKLMKQTGLLQALILLASGVATILAAFNYSLYVTIAVAFVVAFSALQEFEGIQNKLRSTNETLRTLDEVIHWWGSLSVVERRKSSTLEEVVERTEEAYMTLVTQAVATSKKKKKEGDDEEEGEEGDDKDKDKDDKKKE